MIRVHALSRVYLRVWVHQRARAANSPALTTTTVDFAFAEQPADGDWRAGSWQTIGERLYARVLIGPGGVATLARGVRPVLVRVGDNPERPVLHAGYVNVL